MWVEGENFRFVVYTNALMKFISKGIEELGLPSDCLMTAKQWKKGEKSKVDHLVVDEVQDFQEEEIKEFKEASKYLHLFGDTFQQIYKQWKTTINYEVIEKITELRTKRLVFNYRLPRNIAKVAISTRSWQMHKEDASSSAEEFVKNCRNKGESYPWQKSFDSEGSRRVPNECKAQATTSSAELDFVAKYVEEERKTCTTAVLLPLNAYVKFLYEDFSSRGIDCEVKYSNKSVKMAAYSTSDSKVLVSGGTNYTVADTVVLSGGSGSGATASITAVDAGTGAITGFKVAAEGTGYNSSPLVSITSISGAGASISLPLGDNEQDGVNTIDFDTDNLKLLTYHSSKGLQFESVVMPFMTDRTWPFSSKGSIESIFVAMSRAYRNLMITFTGHRIPWLKYAPEDLLKGYGDL